MNKYDLIKWAVEITVSRATADHPASNDTLVELLKKSYETLKELHKDALNS